MRGRQNIHVDARRGSELRGKVRQDVIGGILREGDVVLSVNGQAVSSAAEAGRELQKIAAGRIARLLVWRGDGEVFVTIRKE